LALIQIPQRLLSTRFNIHRLKPNWSFLVYYILERDLLIKHTISPQVPSTDFQLNKAWYYPNIVRKTIYFPQIILFNIFNILLLENEMLYLVINIAH